MRSRNRKIHIAESRASDERAEEDNFRDTGRNRTYNALEFIQRILDFFQVYWEIYAGFYAKKQTDLINLLKR